MVTTQLICNFVFAYAKTRFSHDAAQIVGDIITDTVVYVAESKVNTD